MPFNVEKANEVHQGKYDYSQVVFKNVDTKVQIICPIHGIFEQTPYHHISRQCGCRFCKGDKISVTKRDSLEAFIQKANPIHQNKYDYSMVVFRNYHDKVSIVCPKHGLFLQTPNNHIFSKNGCPQCGQNVSKSGRAWIESVCPQALRGHPITIEDHKFKVDGYDPTTNIVYEYFGKFWHGHPDYFNSDDINPRNGITFGKLYELTLEKIRIIEQSDFNFIYIWGD